MHQEDPFAFLVKDAHKTLRSQSKKPSQHLRPGCRQSIYRNPENWKLGKCIQIIHATEGTIGIFREYFHKLSPSARRLLPAPPGSIVDRNELVFGDWWLHPRFQAPLVREDDAEVRVITLRFNEMLEEYFHGK